jgi:glycosyltransferase involved in cell wall biosynthesis
MTKSSNEDTIFIDLPNVSTSNLSFSRIKILNQIIKTQVLKSDILIIRLPSFIGFIAHKYAKEYNKKIIIELVACPWDAFWNNEFKLKLLAPLVYIKTKHIIRNSSNVIYVTNAFLQKRYPTNGLSISISNVEIESVRDSISFKYINLKNLKIGTIGALDVKYKGQKYVIKAMKLLKEKYSIIVNYYLVGQGDKTKLANYARKLKINKYVHFIGSLEHSKIMEWFETIDIYCQPSLQEGLPRALIEAMSAGKFAIGSNAGGIPELINNKYIFRKKNYKKLAKIITMIDNNQIEEQSNINLNNSRLYIKEVLEDRRKNFISNVINHE